jgi:glycogen synthase
MRVLIVCGLYPPNHDGGYEIACEAFVEHLRADGHSVRILCADHPAASPEDDARRDIHRELGWYKDRNLRFRHLSLPARTRLVRGNTKVFERHLAEFAPDVVNWWAMGGMTLSLIETARKAGLPAIGMVSDEWMLWGFDVDSWLRAFIKRPAWGSIVERALRVPTSVDLSQAARWSFVSDHLRTAVETQGGPLEHTEIGRTGINITDLERHPLRDTFAGRLAYVGRVARVKGVDVAVRALADLPPEHSLDIVGPVDAEYAEELTRLCEDPGLDGRVRFQAGLPRAQLSTVYGASDALIFPVRWEEPWGLVPLESMACGTPVIATGTGGSAEYLRHEENCLLVPRDDPYAVAQAVRRLADEPALRATLYAAGLETAAAHTEERCNAEFERQLTGAAQAAH